MSKPLIDILDNNDIIWEKNAILMKKEIIVLPGILFDEISFVEYYIYLSSIMYHLIVIARIIWGERNGNC